MAIIIKPAVTQRGIESQFQLNKIELSELPVVLADNYFSDIENWSKVQLKYKSTIGGQFEIVEFNAPQENPIGRFFVSPTARNIFEVEKIVIVDHDGGIFLISRADIVFLGLDIILDVEFGEPPSNFSYTVPASFTLNQPIQTISPTVTGDVVIYSISSSLPAGLSFNTTTGVISGTPTQEVSNQVYTITASNNGGTVSTQITLSVLQQAPSSLSYVTPVNYTINEAIASNSPTVTGAVTSYSISSPLPTGLSFNTTTGVISGTPTVLSPSSIYTITATNSGGSTTANISLSVINAVPQFSYIVYSNPTANQTFNNTGGVTDTGFTRAISNVSTADDYEVTFIFNYTSIATDDSFMGMSDSNYTGSTPSGKAGLRTGIKLGNSISTAVGILVNNTVVSTFQSSSFIPGDNNFTLKKVTNDFQFYLNGNLIFTSLNARPDIYEMFPTVMLKSTTTLKQSYYSVAPNEIIYKFSDVMKASNLITSNLNKTLEVSTLSGNATCAITVPISQSLVGGAYFEFTIDSIMPGSTMSFGTIRPPTSSRVVETSWLNNSPSYLGYNISVNPSTLVYCYKNGSWIQEQDQLIYTGLGALTTGDKWGILYETFGTTTTGKISVVKNGSVVGSPQTLNGYAFASLKYFAIQLNKVGDKVTLNDTPVFQVPNGVRYIKPI